jgi:hypothetical protein
LLPSCGRHRLVSRAALRALRERAEANTSR